MNNNYIVLKEVNKSYNTSEKVLTNLDFSLKEGEFVALVGPSGSGKTTILDVICGFEGADSGEIWIDQQKVNQLSPKERDVAMVFQNYALLPHLNTYDNLSFGLKIRKESKAKIREQVTTLAELLGLTDSLSKYPRELSGGQKQRVALGRAIVRRPKLFLMDEPLSNLDSSLRQQTSQEILKLHRELQTTILYVTHAQDEAMTMADRIIVLNQGKIHQIGTPQEVYEQPADTFVARFIGKPAMNIFQGQTQGGQVFVADRQWGQLPRACQLKPGAFLFGVRCENINFTRSSQGLPFDLVDFDYLGQETLYYLKNDSGLQLTVRKQGPPLYPLDERLKLEIDFTNCVIFDVKTEKRIGE